MNCVLFAILLVVATANGREAPRDAINPVESVNRLRGVFSNCEFSAQQNSKADPPRGVGFSIETQMACWICSDARLLRTRERTKIFDESSVVGVGAAVEDSSDTLERFWTPNGSLLQSQVNIQDPSKWLGGVVMTQPTKFISVLSYPKISADADAFWGSILVGEFLADINLSSGITFADLVTDGGRRGFRFQDASWENKQHSIVSYRFGSNEFGSCTASFRRIGDQWWPKRFEIVRESDDRTFVASTSIDNRLKSNLAFRDFSEEPTGLDRLVSIYEIAYTSLPESITKTERRYFQGQESVVNNELVFRKIRTGGITSAKVNQIALPIPNGTEVLPTDEGRKPLRWVMLDGKVSKSLDAAGEQLGTSATFASTRRVGIIVTSIVVAVLASIVIYRRAFVAER